MLLLLFLYFILWGRFWRGGILIFSGEIGLITTMEWIVRSLCLCPCLSIWITCQKWHCSLKLESIHMSHFSVCLHHFALWHLVHAYCRKHYGAWNSTWVYWCNRCEKYAQIAFYSPQETICDAVGLKKLLSEFCSSPLNLARCFTQSRTLSPTPLPLK